MESTVHFLSFVQLRVLYTLKTSEIFKVNRLSLQIFDLQKISLPNVWK